MMPHEDAVAVVDSSPAREEFLHDVMDGLSRPQKQLSSKFFYDRLGSELFEEICRLDEYYLTRTELAILKEHAGEMALKLGPSCVLIEPGSGAGLKTRLLLKELSQPAALVPVDIATDQLARTAAQVKGEFPDLAVLPVSADFTSGFELPPSRNRRVVYFPGSTIGNFTPPAASRLLANFAEVAGEEGGLLIGVDLEKDRDVLEAAYNDRQGVTARFNLNLLRRANRELGADFDLSQFRHRAWYNAGAGRIEMHLESLADQTVRLDGRSFAFRLRETICTEYSHKYTIAGFAELARGSGWRLMDRWTDARDYFAVLYLARQPIRDSSVSDVTVGTR